MLNYYYQNPKYLIIGYVDPLGLRVVELSALGLTLKGFGVSACRRFSLQFFFWWCKQRVKAFGLQGLGDVASFSFGGGLGGRSSGFGILASEPPRVFNLADMSGFAGAVRMYCRRYHN